MADAKHTPAPGPWSAGGNYAFKSVLRDVHGRSIASGGNNRQIQGKELEDSLILAAAAPELLEALRSLLPIVDQLDTLREDGEEEIPEVVAARAAIARATGTQADSGESDHG